jgi:hypothetical protein
MVGNVWVKGSAALPVCNARVIPGDLLLDGPADSVVSRGELSRVSLRSLREEISELK